MEGVDYAMAAFAALTNDERMVFLAQARQLYCADCGGPSQDCECIASDPGLDSSVEGPPEKPCPICAHVHRNSDCIKPRIAHCGLGSHCSYPVARRCICLCAACQEAKAADH